MWCPVGAGLFIEADGSAYPCARLGRKEFLLGNGLRQSLADILETPAWNGIVRTLYARRNGLETCAACLWNNFCQAGCMGLACDRYGSVWEKDDLCPLRRRAYAGAFEDLLLRPHSVPGGSYGRS